MSELKLEKKNLKALARFRNAVHTGDDDPKVGDSWKEFWQIFTQEDFPDTCPMCGKPLSEDDISGCHISFGRVKFDKEFNSQITRKAVEAIEK